MVAAETRIAPRRRTKSINVSTAAMQTPTSEVGHSRPIDDVRGMSALPSIVLQNSFLGCVQNFPGALVRVLKNYVRGHMIDQISNRQPS